MLPLCLALTLVAADPPRALVVVTVEHANTDLPVDDDKVASAIALRLVGRDVDVRTDPTLVGPRWTVAISSGASSVVVRIRSPEDRDVRSGTLSIKRRQPEDIAQTIAIWVIEALTPVMPELAAQMPETVVEPETPAEPEPARQPEPEPEPPQRTHALKIAPRLGIGAQRLFPGDHTLGLLELGAIWQALPNFGPLLLVDASTKADDHVTGAEVSARRGGLTLAAEWRHSFGAVTLRAHLGPMLRALFVAAHGADVRFSQRTYVDAGAQVSLSGSTTVSFAEIGLALRAERYFAYPTFVIDGQRALDMGSTAATAMLWIQPHF